MTLHQYATMVYCMYSGRMRLPGQAMLWMPCQWNQMLMR